MKVSNSEIQTLKDCPRKWWLTYYRELALINVELTGARPLGTNIHTVLQGYYQDGVDPVEGIKELYAAQIKEAEHAGKSAATLRKDADLALAMVQGYMDWIAEQAVDVDLELISTEQVLEYRLDPALVNGHEVWLRGKLDARFRRRSDGASLFMDHKTVQSIDVMNKLLPMNEQMKFYHLLEYLCSQGQQWTDGALFNMLRKVKRTATAKPPFYERSHVGHNQEVLRTTWERTISIIQRLIAIRESLDAGTSHHLAVPPRPNNECTWKCDFFAMCPLFDDGSNVEGLLAERYHRIDPHERYDVAEKGTGE